LTMQKGCFFIVFSLLVVSCYCQDLEFSFEGLWTDDIQDGGFGGNFSICVDGNNAWGLYTEFGLTIGTISDDGLTFTGTFYEGGETGDDNCIIGPFSITLVENGTRFEGLYGCREKLLYNWSGRRINSEEQSDHDCAKVISFSNNKQDLDGKWFKASNGEVSLVDFCTNTEGGYQTSYSQPSFTPEGYDEGVWFHSRKFATGTFYRANNNGALPGVSLWFVNPDGNLANVWWAGLTADLNIAQIHDADIHGYDIYEYTHGTTSSLCARYSALANQPFDYYPYEEELFSFPTYEREYPDFTLSTSEFTTVEVSSNATTIDSVSGYSTGLSTVDDGISTNQSSDSSVVAYSFTILLITLLFC